MKRKGQLGTKRLSRHSGQLCKGVSWQSLSEKAKFRDSDSRHIDSVHGATHGLDYFQILIASQ